MQDIADLAGVSRATVSAVLNGKPSVSLRTRNRVFEALRRAEAPPRVVARSVLTHLSQMVGMIIRDIANPFNVEVTLGVSEVLTEAGFELLLGQDKALEEHVETLQVFEQSRLRGYILSPFEKGRTLEYVRQLIESGTPVVIFGNPCPELHTHSVTADLYLGSRLAAEHVLGRGHDRIAYLAGPSHWTVERVRGYVDVMIEHGNSYQLVLSVGDTSEAGYRKAIELLTAKEMRPTAVLCFNDRVAVGVYRAAHELGLRIPDDLSVVGFDNTEISGVMGPPLTTVSVFTVEMGRMTARLLLQALAGQTSGEPVHQVIRPQIVERDSVRAIERETPMLSD
jgi:DNA-binding LacI/PurR family transcriptional regulator